MNEIQTIACPECGNDIELKRNQEYRNGDIIECSVCGSELEVANVKDDGSVEVIIVEEEK